MTDKVRVSFDVPADQHAYIKSECAKNMIPLRDFLREMIAKKVQEFKKMDNEKKTLH